MSQIIDIHGQHDSQLILNPTKHIVYLDNFIGEEIAKDLKDDEKLGARIVLKALEEPIKQIAINAGLEPAVILEKVKNSEAGFGFDAANNNYVDMKKVGVVDPTKVTRSALQNAASIASMVLTTESIVTDKKEEKACSCGHNDMPADMGGMY